MLAGTHRGSVQKWALKVAEECAHYLFVCMGLGSAAWAGCTHLLDGGEARHDGLALREAQGANGHGDREDGGHRDGDAAHNEHDNVGEGGAPVRPARALVRAIQLRSRDARSQSPCSMLLFAPNPAERE
jgi:hypothetical protein